MYVSGYGGNWEETMGVCQSGGGGEGGRDMEEYVESIIKKLGSFLVILGIWYVL